MTDQERVEHIKRLDRLYLAACEARDKWIADSSAVNWRRWLYARDRYDAVKAQGAQMMNQRGSEAA